jgi:Uma2 family endonuclease
MSTVIQTHSLSAEEYLQGEITSEVKHELIDGSAYAMAGASGNHERISMTIARKFGNHLEKLPCEPFGSDMKVKVGFNFFYPDVTVDCDFDESQPYYTETPVIIVEVLSKSTRKTDQTIKRRAYLNLPSLQEYVLIEQDFVDIEVVRRREGWQPNHYYLGDEVTFESIELTLPVEDIYHRVQNEDMLEFLAKKTEE